MGRFLKYSAGFACTSLGLYVLFIVALGELLPQELRPNIVYPIGGLGHAYTRFQEVREYQQVDILFLGSSKAYRGIDTRFFSASGYHSFNLGSSAQSHLQTNLLLKRHLQDLRPKLVIYEVSPEMFQTDGVESSIDLIANTEIDRHMIQMVLKVNELKVYNTFVFGCYRKLFRMDEGYEESLTVDLDTYVKGGYVERQVRHFDYGVPKTDVAFKMKDMQWTAFVENLNLIRESKSPIVLIKAPSSTASGLSNSIAINSLILESNPTIPLLDYGNNLGLSDSLHFFDELHLNRFGVEVFNSALLSDLNNLGLLPKERK